MQPYEGQVKAMMRYRLLILALAILLNWGPSRAWQLHAAEPDKLVKRFHDVRAFCKDEQSAHAMTCAISSLFPQSWASVGGKGTQKLNRNGRLEVLQTVEAHQMISALLRSLTAIATERARNQRPAGVAMVVGQAGSQTDQGTRLTTRVYDVSGVVNAARGETTHGYANALQAQIDPGSWNVTGGPADITALPALQVLVISQSDELHKEVQAFLDGKR